MSHELSQLARALPIRRGGSHHRDRRCGRRDGVAGDAARRPWAGTRRLGHAARRPRIGARRLGHAARRLRDAAAPGEGATAVAGDARAPREWLTAIETLLTEDAFLPIQWTVLPVPLLVSLERLLASPGKRRLLGTPGRLRLLKRL